MQNFSHWVLKCEARKGVGGPQGLSTSTEAFSFFLSFFFIVRLLRGVRMRCRYPDVRASRQHIFPGCRTVMLLARSAAARNQGSTTTWINVASLLPSFRPPTRIKSPRRWTSAAKTSGGLSNFGRDSVNPLTAVAAFFKANGGSTRAKQPSSLLLPLKKETNPTVMMWTE